MIKGTGIPDAHIMLTTRSIQKTVLWNDKQKTTYKLDENGEKVPVIDVRPDSKRLGLEPEDVAAGDHSNQ